MSAHRQTHHTLPSAVTCKDTAAVALCLENGEDANAPYAQGEDMQYPLHLAAMGGDVAIIKLLLAHGAAIDAMNGQQLTPYFLAVINGHIEAVEVFKSKNAKFTHNNKLPPENGSPLITSLFYEQEELALHFLAQDCDPRHKDEVGKTPLHYAAQYGMRRVISKLLSLGADINARDNNDSTPLICAIAQKRQDTAFLLLDCNANPNGENSVGNSALIQALRLRMVPVIRRLIECGADTAIEKTRAGSAVIAGLPHAKEYLEIYHLLNDAPKIRADYVALLAEKRRIKTVTTVPIKIGKPLTFIRRK